MRGWATRAPTPRAAIRSWRSIPYWPRQPHIAIFRRILARAWRRGYEQAAGPLGDMALFYAWAGAVMLRDLAPRAARSGSDMRLDRVRRWTSEWKQHAGLSMA